ncbi:MAG: methyltransferase domain-containing protein [Planctomycetota bacterium]
MFTFLRQSFKDFRNTGALAPSGLFLARAMVKSLPPIIPPDYQVLEVGPGTGAFTVELVRRMNGAGHLDLWEISPDFCQALRERLITDPKLRQFAACVAVHEGDVRNLKVCAKYDAIISGLPFNNFEPREVREFLEHFRALLKPRGILVWFEYVAIRRIQTPFVGRARRERLKGIGDVTLHFTRKHQFKQQIVPINFPPARVRHLTFG